MKKTLILTATDQAGYGIHFEINSKIAEAEAKGYEFVSCETRLGGGGEVRAKVVGIIIVVMQKDVSST